jgi:PhoH-like ATPase
MTRKTYVIDTSVLIYDPYVYKQLANSDVTIPIFVLNELDKLKKGSSEASRNARVAIRFLDEISDRGDISTGILLDDDVMLRVDTNYLDLTDISYSGFGDPTYGDTQILACAYAHWLHNHDTTLVSNDINLRVKAKARGLDAQAHEGARYNLSDLYSGVQVIVNEEAGLDLQQQGFIDPRLYGFKLNPNECVLFSSDDGDGIAMGKLSKPDKLRVLKKTYPWNIAARNMEQTFLIDLIMERDIDLITAIGQAGTGKTLVALAAALELVINRREYEKLIIYKPIESVGKDLGYLPGTVAEKLAPHFVSIMDNLEILFTNKNNDWKRDLEMFQKKGRIEMEAIAYIRGRSIPNAIIMVDEAQNLSNSEIKTILTRAGEGSKIILTGDIFQIDTDDLDATDNGLTYVVEKFKSSGLAGHITLCKGERSRLATVASEIL